MKKLLLAVMAMLLLSCSGSDDSTPVTPVVALCDNYLAGDLRLTTQAQIDAFASEHNCGLEGTLYIGELGVNSDINDLSGLSSLKEIKGDLIINNAPQLATLHGLENLVTINNLQIQYTGLETLEHLQSLKEINATVAIRGNTKLKNLKGFPKLLETASLSIEYNDVLENFEGLEGLVKITNLEVSNNPSLSSFQGLNNVNYIDGLSIYRNSALASINALENLQTLRSLVCSENPVLTTLPFDKIKEMEKVSMSKLNFTTLDGFNNVTRIDTLQLVDMPNLTSLQGLESVKIIQTMYLVCENLSSVSVLSSLTSVDGYINLSGSKLTTLSGLENITSFKGELQFSSNFTLRDYCAVKNIMSQVKTFTAEDNAYNPTKEDILAGNCSQ